MKISGYKAFLRTSRLISRKIQANSEKKLATIQAKLDGFKISKLPNIIGKLSTIFFTFTNWLITYLFFSKLGTVEQTFKQPPDEFTTHNIDDSKLFDMPLVSVSQLKKNNKKVFNPEDKVYKQSYWCYDTPGVVHQDHVCWFEFLW